ncbi:MAG: HPF/RaiA family ribosome-associated protein [Spirochaetaceae bacterium]|nr:HPF/RaiA family ribosome-associated protein [Spirochaetaceae bacterium]MDH7483955.1 HPF/RaiA family ribosome-associated protein [Spirochaetales bacterium]
MKVDVRSVHFDLGTQSREYLNTKLNRIDYAKDMIVDLLFVFTKDAGQFRLEATANFRWGKQAHVVETSLELNPGIDVLIDKLEQKIVKEKEKIQEKK